MRIPKLTGHISLFGIRPNSKTTNQDYGHRMDGNSKFDIFFALFLLNSEEKVCEAVHFESRKCVQTRGGLTLNRTVYEP